MLTTRSIPIYEDDPEDWHTFLYKAANGSIKAVDTMNGADLAYMVALTKDPSAPETMHLDDYHALLRERFPAACPLDSLQQFHNLAVKHNWVAKAFQVSESPINDPFAYMGLWGRRAVSESALLNDAMLCCVQSWSAEHFMQCLQEHKLDYDARLVVCGMLYLTLTWP